MTSFSKHHGAFSFALSASQWSTLLKSVNHAKIVALGKAIGRYAVDIENVWTFGKGYPADFFARKGLGGSELPATERLSRISCIKFREDHYGPFSHSDVCWGNYRSGGLNVGVSMALPGH
jgi:hypothetical protein